MKIVPSIFTTMSYCHCRNNTGSIYTEKPCKCKAFLCIYVIQKVYPPKMLEPIRTQVLPAEIAVR